MKVKGRIVYSEGEESIRHLLSFSLLAAYGGNVKKTFQKTGEKTLRNFFINTGNLKLEDDEILSEKREIKTRKDWSLGRRRDLVH